MAFTLYDAAAPIFVRGLTSLSGVLDKAAASGLDEATLVTARLAPDMKPLADQIDMATFSARGCVARLAGLEVPGIAGPDTTFAQMQDRIARSIAFIEGVDRAAFDGAETRRVELRFPGVELDFDGAGYLTSFALPNFHFHVTTAYAILRQQGVALGKRDYLGKLALI
ncbi:MAG: DUF1993 domain-containing protein [Brevundimonas sp.]|uniref:DUF1993 domain-containing protein n=1 Tax=Brevundimonas sp. TaxID=1871086 RepID=UPI001216A753|nr:DUF1993 domain-containing protein [Brevundimonas sp.]RZJ17198.1 MAG: DUF1993 domain-containing protein [Brevundimonas sp.]